MEHQLSKWILYSRTFVSTAEYQLSKWDEKHNERDVGGQDVSQPKHNAVNHLILDFVN